VWHGSAGQAGYGSTWHGLVRHGWVWPGTARSVRVRLGWAGLGMARYTRTAYTGVRVPGSCFARKGVRLGSAWRGMVRHGTAWRGLARYVQVRSVPVGSGAAWLGVARFGWAWITAIILRRGKVWSDLVWCGVARRGLSWHGWAGFGLVMFGLVW